MLPRASSSTDSTPARSCYSRDRRTRRLSSTGEGLLQEIAVHFVKVYRYIQQAPWRSPGRCSTGSASGPRCPGSWVILSLSLKRIPGARLRRHARSRSSAIATAGRRSGTSSEYGALLGVVSGRCRQGKTYLLDAACRAAGGFYFGATEATDAESLRRIGTVLTATRRGTRGPRHGLVSVRALRCGRGQHYAGSWNR